MSIQSDSKELKSASKFMSLVLRHAPKLAGLTLENDGWASVDSLLSGMSAKGLHLSREDLDYIVENNDKSRFAFDESRLRIRASQGHSVSVDLKLAPLEPPDVLYHGTNRMAVPSILREGLRRMKRHHVHLSLNLQTAKAVASRRGEPVLFEVDAKAMDQKGFEFYLSENHVWLTLEVPPCFLREMESDLS